MPAVRHGEDSPKCDTQSPRVAPAPPANAAKPPKTARNPSDVPATRGMRYVPGTMTTVSKGMAAPTANVPAEANAACTGRATQGVRKAQFVADMGGERVMGRELLGDLSGERWIEAAMHVDRGQFCQLCPFVVSQFLAFAFDVGLFGIRLGTDRDVLTSRHRHGPRDQAGDPCDQDFVARRLRCCYADHKTRRRHDAVVRSQHRRAQPADAFVAVSLAVGHGHIPYYIWREPFLPTNFVTRWPDWQGHSAYSSTGQGPATFRGKNTVSGKNTVETASRWERGGILLFWSLAAPARSRTSPFRRPVLTVSDCPLAA